MRRTLLDVDGDFGGRTERAVIAVKRAHHVTPANGAVDAATWTMLEQQPSSATDAAQHGRGPEYDRMLEDGLLDVTLAIGFDEHGVLVHEAKEIRRGLAEVRSFTEDEAAAEQLRTAAGRPHTPGGRNYVKRDYNTSHGQPVHAALRLVEPTDESGGTGRERRRLARRRDGRDGPERPVRLRRPRPLRHGARLRPQLPLRRALGLVPEPAAGQDRRRGDPGHGRLRGRHPGQHPGALRGARGAGRRRVRPPPRRQRDDQRRPAEPRARARRVLHAPRQRGPDERARHRDHREPLPAVDVQRLLDARLRALACAATRGSARATSTWSSPTPPPT